MSYLSSMFAGIRKFFTRDRVIILAILLVLAYAMGSYEFMKSSYQSVDAMTTQEGAVVAPSSVTEHAASTSTTNGLGTTTEPSAGGGGGGGASSASIARPHELLPTDHNAAWASLNPAAVGQGGMVLPDMLVAGRIPSLDSVGQTKKNPNLQLRSDPLIPKMDTGPWMQSTIEPDMARVPLEVGSYRG